MASVEYEISAKPEDRNLDTARTNMTHRVLRNGKKTLKKFVLNPELVLTITQTLIHGELRHNIEQKVPS